MVNHSAGLSPATLSALIALVRKHTGIAMTERKSILLERRLRPRMQALEIGSYQAYLDKVEQDRAEIPHFIDLVTTNDTLFFQLELNDFGSIGTNPIGLLRRSIPGYGKINELPTDGNLLTTQ